MPWGAAIAAVGTIAASAINSSNQPDMQATGGSSSNGTGHQQNTLPANMTNDINGLLDQSTAAAASPYPNYTGEQVAPLNGTQQQAFNGIAGANGSQNPYNAAAAGLINQGSQQIAPTMGTFGAQQLAQYGNPYTQSVIDTTNQQIQRQAAIGNQSIAGNAAEAGAYGGDRATVAQTENNRNALNAISLNTANLNSANFSQAQQQFNTEQNRNLAAQEADTTNAQKGASLYGTLGQTQQSEAIAGNNALLGVGNQQQTQQQNVDTNAYNQFMAQSQWPESQLSWLHSITGSVPYTSFQTMDSSNTGNSTQLAPVNPVGQAVGAASALAGIGSQLYNSYNNNQSYINPQVQAANDYSTINNGNMSGYSGATDSFTDYGGAGGIATGGLVGYARGGIAGFADGGDTSDGGVTDDPMSVTDWPYYPSTDAHLHGQQGAADVAGWAKGASDAASAAGNWLMEPQDQHAGIGSYLGSKAAGLAGMFQPDVPQGSPYADTSSAAPAPASSPATMGLDGTQPVAAATPASAGMPNIYVDPVSGQSIDLGPTPAGPPPSIDPTKLYAGSPQVAPAVQDETGGRPNPPDPSLVPPGPKPMGPNMGQADPPVVAPKSVVQKGIAVTQAQQGQVQPGQGIAAGQQQQTQQQQQGQQYINRGIAAGQQAQQTGDLKLSTMSKTLIAMGAAMMDNHSPTFLGAMGQGLKAGLGEYTTSEQLAATNALKSAQLQQTMAERQAAIDQRRETAYFAHMDRQAHNDDYRANAQDRAAASAQNAAMVDAFHRDSLASQDAWRQGTLALGQQNANNKATPAERDQEGAAKYTTELRKSGMTIDQPTQDYDIATNYPNSPQAKAILSRPGQVPRDTTSGAIDTSKLIPGRAYLGADGKSTATWTGAGWAQ